MKRPVFLMRTEGVTDRDYNAVKGALLDVRKIGDALGMPTFEIRDFDVWRSENWKVDGDLTPWNSVDWYVEESFDSQRGQVDSSALAGLLDTEPWKKQTPHEDVFVLDQDMYYPGTNFVVGSSSKPRHIVIISTHRLRKQDQEVLKTLGYHEIGHDFGLPGEGRKEYDPRLGDHCVNNGCSMRQGMMVPDDWIRMTKERLITGTPYCGECTSDLVDKIAD